MANDIPTYKLRAADAQSSGNSTVITATVLIDKDVTAPRAMRYLNEPDFKLSLAPRVAKQFNLTGGGFAPWGGTRPFFSDPSNRAGLLGYERDFKFTASI